MDEAWFKARYDTDAANKAKQAWNEYWNWVQSFYKGKTFPPVPGWAKREADLARQHAGRDDVARALADTGRILAAEWAKDNAVRKVSTNDLQHWGKTFSDAAKNADTLLAALKQVQDEVRRRTGEA